MSSARTDPILPRPFALLAVVLGVTSPVLGLVGLFAVTANNNGPTGAAINVLVAAQGLWIAAASITLAYRRPHLQGDDRLPGFGARV